MGENIAKVFKLVYVMIIFIFLFVDAKESYVTDFPCAKRQECPKTLCTLGFRRSCERGFCVCY
uniref:Nodule-specific cysteine-rich peptide G04 n=1 Tax=Pisum sativum TaxID=3888 RepID=A0A7T8DV26_PEA|nr:nodule-specific cysteine-rich peptide G04 [Pisum sativum]